MRIISFIVILLLSQVSRLSAEVITSIEQLDQKALFHYSVLSDLIDDSNRPNVARSLTWMKNSEFVLGGGDDVKARGTAFEKYIGSDSYFKTKFYPSIGDGECQAYGGAQSAWGKGSEFFRFIPGFWDRSNVVRCPNEPRDAWGGTPSYYCFFKPNNSEVTIHVLQLHWSDQSVLDSRTRQFMLDKLNDFASLKKMEPGKHFVHIHVHNGPWIKAYMEQAAKNLQGSKFEDMELLLATADITTDASQHLPRRFWTGDIFFDDTKNWWNKRLTDDFEDPNVCLWYNTGIVKENGYMEFHVFTNPVRVVAQYVRNTLEKRQLVTAQTWADRAQNDLKPIMKQIDGPCTYVDWKNFPINATSARAQRCASGLVAGLNHVAADRSLNGIRIQYMLPGNPGNVVEARFTLFDLGGKQLAEVVKRDGFSTGSNDIVLFKNNGSVLKGPAGVFLVQMKVLQRGGDQQLFCRPVSIM